MDVADAQPPSREGSASDAIAPDADGAPSREARIAEAGDGHEEPGEAPSSHRQPSKNTAFYWDLTNTGTAIDNTEAVNTYDIDGWNNDASEVARLHGMGFKVFCYMDVGSYEPARPDSNSFPASLQGNGLVGWPGETWLDVQPSGPHYAKLQAIMRARFFVCQSKGFDAIKSAIYTPNATNFATTSKRASQFGTPSLKRTARRPARSVPQTTRQELSVPYFRSISTVPSSSPAPMTSPTIISGVVISVGSRML